MEDIQLYIIPIYITSVIVGIIIFYCVIKAAIKNAIREINEELKK
jgi:hypothetical protein